jgi:Fe-S oxidoreductase
MEPSTDPSLMEEQGLKEFANKASDGSQREIRGKEAFDYRAFYEWMADATHLLLSKNELTWMDAYREPDRKVDVFVNMSCGSQLAPHLTLETVGVLRALGVDFIAASGRQFCCGKIYHSTDQPRAAERVTDGSLRRFAEWGAETAVHVCPSCQIFYGHHLSRLPQAAPGLINKHFTTFLEERLDGLGDRVPWKTEVKANVLLESHDNVTPVHTAATQSAQRILTKIPGVKVMSALESPSFGPACKTTSSGQSVLEFLSDHERQDLHAELEAQARAAGGADTIVTTDKLCQREWCKWATDRLAVRHYVSIIAEALGCAHPDRFQEMWKLHDPEKVFERTRPYWSSWGLTEEQGRWLAIRNFDPHHNALQPKCACGGDSAKCNTGRMAIGHASQPPTAGT